MGFDINVQIFHGFKFQLRRCIRLGIISEDIIDGDDWQFINMNENYDELIEKYILSERLKKNLLRDQGHYTTWKIYFAFPTQSGIDPDESHLIVYRERETLYEGSPVDCKTGIVDSDMMGCGYTQSEIQNIFEKPCDYEMHYTVECSW